MRRSYCSFAFVAVLWLSSLAQDKPRVFVQAQAPEGNGTGNGKRWGILGAKSAGNPQDDATEFGKYVEQDCKQVALTRERANSDYTVMLTRAAQKKNRDLRTAGQIQVTNRAGKSVGTNFLHTSGNAPKDACELIERDWNALLQGPERNGTGTAESELAPAVTKAPSLASRASVPVAGTEAITTRFQTSSSTSVATGGGSAAEDMGEAARRAKQHAACLKAARENPSITCK